MSRATAMRRGRGFSLIELMVVVAIIAIIASIALPSYQEQVRKSRRAALTGDLAELAQGLERFHTVNNTYVGFALPFNESPRNDVTAYGITLTNVGRDTFLLTATPQGPQVSDAGRCGNFTLNQAGTRTNSGPWELDRCW